MPSVLKILQPAFRIHLCTWGNLTAVERLVAVAPRMTESCIDFIQAHKVEVVRRGEKKLASGSCDAVHFRDGPLYQRQVFNRFARQNNVKRVIGERQVPSIALDDGTQRRFAPPDQFSFCYA